MTLTREDLAALGRLVWGPRWQTRLARARGVDARTVRRWLAGTRGVDAGTADWLLDQAAVTLAGHALRGTEHGVVPRAIVLAVYRSDAELRDLTGEPWTAATHRALMGRLAAHLAEAYGVPATLAEIDADAYRRWLAGRANTTALRSAFAAGAPAPGP